MANKEECPVGVDEGYARDEWHKKHEKSSQRHEKRKKLVAKKLAKKNKFKHWKRDEKQLNFMNFDMISDRGDKETTLGVHITESWNEEDTGNVLIDFKIQTGCTTIESTVYIPNTAWKELVKIQKMAKVEDKRDKKAYCK